MVLDFFPPYVYSTVPWETQRISGASSTSFTNNFKSCGFLRPFSSLFFFRFWTLVIASTGGRRFRYDNALWFRANKNQDIRTTRSSIGSFTRTAHYCCMDQSKKDQESRHKYWTTRLSICLFARTAQYCSMDQSKQESRHMYWTTCSSIRLFSRTDHYCSALLASLARVRLSHLFPCTSSSRLAPSHYGPEKQKIQT